MPAGNVNLPYQTGVNILGKNFSFNNFFIFEQTHSGNLIIVHALNITCNIIVFFYFSVCIGLNAERMDHI